MADQSMETGRAYKKGSSHWLKVTTNILLTDLVNNPILNLNSLYTNHLLPLVGCIEKDLFTWNPLFLAWFGRMAALKMDILPWVPYPFPNTTEFYLKNLKSMALYFIFICLLTSLTSICSGMVIGLFILDLFHHFKIKQ